MGARLGYSADADTTVEIASAVEVHTLQIRAPTGAGNWLWDIKPAGLLKVTSAAMLPCFAGGGDASQIEALGVPKGEGALLNYGRKPDGSLRTDQR